jgi:hypothetical protein
MSSGNAYNNLMSSNTEQKEQTGKRPREEEIPEASQNIKSDDHIKKAKVANQSESAEVAKKIKR